MNLVTKIISARFSKFIFVGVLNTAIDLLVLNVLVYTFGTQDSTVGYLLCKTASFTVAVLHCYAWNKYWIFRNADGAARTGEASLFFLVSTFGLIINAGVSSAFFHVAGGTVPVQYAFLAVNLSALVGTFAVLLWNFFGYSRIVFRS